MHIKILTTLALVFACLLLLNSTYANTQCQYFKTKPALIRYKDFLCSSASFINSRKVAFNAQLNGNKHKAVKYPYKYNQPFTLGRKKSSFCSNSSISSSLPLYSSSSSCGGGNVFTNSNSPAKANWTLLNAIGKIEKNRKKMESNHPYASFLKTLQAPSDDGQTSAFEYFDIRALNPEKVDRLPYSIKVLLESAVRNCNGETVTTDHVDRLLNWESTCGLNSNGGKSNGEEVSFMPSRVLLQDFTGVPCMVDLAAMRDALCKISDKLDIHPQIPVHLVIDHSVQVDKARSSDASTFNEELEFERNSERFAFLKWAAQAFQNTCIVPPGSGIVHQVNLEYLASVVCNKGNLLYPDSLIGTDSHTTMIDGLGVAGWGVGGIEAEAVMLGQPLSMVLPKVYGVHLTGQLRPECTATDLVLHLTALLRKKNVVDSFVEYWLDTPDILSAADRATLANMSPEYGATMGFFPVDEKVLKYLKQTARKDSACKRIDAYLSAVGLFKQTDAKMPQYTEIIRVNLADIVPCVAGPKRPQDKIPLSDLSKEFKQSLERPIGFNGFGIKNTDVKVDFNFEGKTYTLQQGSIVISAITSCTNTSNPSVMLGAGLLAKKAVEKGLTVPPYIKTSLSPGSGVVLKYLQAADLLTSLEALGFYLAGFGCMTCIGNSGELPKEVTEAIQSTPDLVAASILSGNRNFEGRVHPLTRANFLASPILCVAFAIAGRIDFDINNSPIGYDLEKKPIFLADIWPSREEIAKIEEAVILPQLFQETYQNIQQGNPQWRALQAPSGKFMEWPKDSSYINRPPFFSQECTGQETLEHARCLLLLGDSVTTDHISPAGRIEKDSPAAKYLMNMGVLPSQFNSYGSRRGHDQVMMRGTFANIRLLNHMASRTGPFTVHVPSGKEMPIFEAVELYRQEKTPLVVIAGKEYGSGSSRDWAAKGVWMQNIKCIIAESFERIHRSNLVGMGVLPLEFMPGESASQLGLTGHEEYSIPISLVGIRSEVPVHVKTNDGEKTFMARSRIDSKVELSYVKAGGILQYVMQQRIQQAN